MNNDKLIESIKLHEGFRTKPYDDATGKELKAGDTIIGNITIGYGTNITAGLSRFEAEWLLEQRLQKGLFAATMHVAFFNTLPVSRQEVILEMIYNMGLPRFLTFKNFIAKIQNGDFISAADELVRNSDGSRTKWAQQVGKRADDLAEKFKHG